MAKKSNIKLGIVSNNTIERKEEYKKLLTNEFIDFFEITSQELNDNLDDFILDPTSIVNTDKEIASLDELVENISNNIASAYYALGLTTFTFDVLKYQSLLPDNYEGWEVLLGNISQSVQELMFEQSEINVVIKGLEKIALQAGQNSTWLSTWLSKLNLEFDSYNEEEDTKVSFSTALTLTHGTKLSPQEIAQAKTIYLTPVRPAKNLTYREPEIRMWANALIKAQTLSEEPIALIYEDDVASVASIANLIQIFKPESRAKIQSLNLSEPIDKFKAVENSEQKITKITDIVS